MHQQRQRNWFEKNWWWSIPSCCLGCLGLMAGSCALLVGGTWTFVRSSTPFQEAVEIARAHPEVIARLGEPIETGWQLSGNFNTEDNSSTARFTIPLTGPEGAATLYSRAHKVDGEWVFDRLEVEFDDGTTLDLRDSRDSPGRGAAA